MQAPGPPRTRLPFRPMPSGKRARQQRQEAARSTAARALQGRPRRRAAGVAAHARDRRRRHPRRDRRRRPRHRPDAEQQRRARHDGSDDGPTIGIASGTPATGMPSTRARSRTRPSSTKTPKASRRTVSSSATRTRPSRSSSTSTSSAPSGGFVTTAGPHAHREVRPAWEAEDQDAALEHPSRPNDGGVDSLRGQKATIGAERPEQGVQLRRRPLLEPGRRGHRLAERRGGREHRGERQRARTRSSS